MGKGNFAVSVKYFTVACQDSGILIWEFLHNVNTQEQFYETKIWD